MEASGIVQQIGTANDLWVVRVRSPGETRYLVVWASPRGPRVFWASADAKKAAFDGKLPRGYAPVRVGFDLEGAHVERTHARGAVLRAGDRRVALTCARGRVSALLLPASEAPEDGPDEPSSAAEAEAWLGELVRGALDRHKKTARDVLERAKTKLARRAEAVRADLAKMSEAEAIIGTAQWLVAEAARAPRGARELTVTDWSTGEAKPVTIALDPAKPARAQVEAMFKRGRRLKAGRPFAEARLADATARAAAMDALLARVGDATDLDAVDALLAEAKKTSPREVTLPSGGAAPARARAAKEAGPQPFRAYRGAADQRILVGKGGEKNDVLTFRVAGPHDLFLHVKGVPGAHVIVPLAKSKSCPADLLVDAALLAAHFSKAKDEAVIDVEYTPRKYVRKPKDGAPGLVLVEREKVLPLRPDPARLRALLETEE